MMAKAGKGQHKSIDNTGFGVNSSNEGGRLTNKDGSVNLTKTGMPFWETVSMYHTLLRMPRTKFLAAIFLFYTVVNLLFATIYFLMGAENLQGMNGDGNMLQQFTTAFFFSSQTLTTVGYGHISPNGFWTNCIASLESFMGILSFALVTGMLYARFTRPKAYLLFSENMLVAPYKEGRGLMIRMASYKNNHLTDAEAVLTVALHTSEGGNKVTKFYPISLEIAKINSMALNWTLVHALNEDSPMYGFTNEDFRDNDIELIVNIKAFDDHFSNTVQQRTSYTYEELVYGAKFSPMYRRSETGGDTILELDKINAWQKVPLPGDIESYAAAATVSANA